ncbi:uncharacterized protein DUF4301 [Winogradskyella wandonensis]|uniref:Uncharacterized protein DUF4301 n=1 Tax=Winogradskyella wandonensis TaxID=1442586 RepID=A0A4V2PT47_9FLAO|nr:DUF4301 family protein [Winogradskyella wandonensis]TCK65101.1 uncharacterized protein DUF4301 [Winogradskyella wandonensis]
MKFSEKDIEQIEAHNLSIEIIYRQIEQFKSGVNFTNLKAAAVINNGIIAPTYLEVDNYVKLFDENKDKLSIVKFVPASGAATRMFKFLFDFLKDYNPKVQSLNAFINKNQLKDLTLFLIALEKFPFYHKVLEQLKENRIDYDSLNPNEKAYEFVKAMLEEDQLNFGAYPKGLFPFHKYNNDISTAFEEHLFEMAFYGSRKTPLWVHFTISEVHKNKFTEEFKRIEERVESITGFPYEIAFSYQHQSTDTIALNTKNEPFRNDDGSLYFRPSGHGALLRNLNAIDADVIFISNIDNVVVKHYKAEVAKYKKVLAGMLIEVRQTIFSYIKLLKTKKLGDADLDEIGNFITNKLNYHISEEFEKYSHKYKVEYLIEALNRPIRVCGMVKNEGEPGGGPFWVKDESGKVSLQIVESAQINKKDKRQKRILDNATHFNPVDIVCSIKDYEGKTFDLEQFVNHNAAFITMKTKVGKSVKALELPGLWNGSMAYWNSIFVEVPVSTFNPVKTVNDLLKPSHQLS